MLKADCKDCACLVCHCKEEWFCDEVNRNIADVDVCPEESIDGGSGIESEVNKGELTMTKAEEFQEKLDDNSWKDGELFELAIDMLENLEAKKNRFLTIAYNAITLAQLNEQYSFDRLCSELGCSKEEWLEIVEGDENLEEIAKGE